MELTGACPEFIHERLHCNADPEKINKWRSIGVEAKTGFCDERLESINS